MSKALFVCYGGGHADALIPVMRYLNAYTDVHVSAIGINLAVEKLREAGIPCKSLSAYLDIDSVEIGFPLARARHDFSSKMSFADSIAYYGFTVSDLISEVGRETADKILAIYDRRTMFPCRTMTRILNQERPDVVVTTAMNRFEVATLYAAGRLGIPTVKVEDLIGRIRRTFPDKMQVDTEAEKEALIRGGIRAADIVLREELCEPSIANYVERIYHRRLNIRPTAVAVFCQFVKDDLVKRGIPAASIHVTGQPAFDQHPHYAAGTDKIKVCEALGADPSKPIITFMSQPLADRVDILNMLSDALKMLPPDIQVILKLHPNEDGQIQRLILSEREIDVTIVKDIDARELLAVSDLIMTVSSTTGLEAAVMGKPLVYINTTGEEDVIPYEKMGIGIRCTNAAEIEASLRKILIDHDFSAEQFAQYTSDGLAAKRVAEIVEALSKKRAGLLRRAVIIIQARMGSTRLPGKVMLPLAGKPIIQHLVDRMARSQLAQDVVVAIPAGPDNRLLRQYLTEHEIHWCEGDENDVLKRYIEAAEQHQADIIVRVTADNPLTSVECIDQMLEAHIQTQADYTIMDGLPLGVTGEIMNLAVLKHMSGRADLTPRDKEHVTIYIREHPDQFRVHNMSAPAELYAPDLALTVDTQEDYQNMQRLYDSLYDGEYIKTDRALAFLQGQPGAMRREKA